MCSSVFKALVSQLKTPWYFVQAFIQALFATTVFVEKIEYFPKKNVGHHGWPAKKIFGSTLP